MDLNKFLIVASEFLLLLLISFFLTADIFRPLYLLQKVFTSESWLKSVESFKQQSPAKNEIIFIGNSLTSQFDLTVFNDKKIINMGIAGDFTLGIQLRLAEIIDSKPEKIFIEIGINDILARISSVEIVKNYSSVIEEIKRYSPSTQILVQSIFPVSLEKTVFISNREANKRILKVNNSLKQLSDQNDIVYIDLYRSFVKNESLNPRYTKDGVHLNKDGYSLWKELIRNHVINKNNVGA